MSRRFLSRSSSVIVQRVEPSIRRTKSPRNDAAMMYIRQGAREEDTAWPPSASKQNVAGIIAGSLSRHLPAERMFLGTARPVETEARTETASAFYLLV
jgi:hypothetical protein